MQTSKPLYECWTLRIYLFVAKPQRHEPRPNKNLRKYTLADNSHGPSQWHLVDDFCFLQMGYASSAEKKFPHVWSISTLCTLGLGKTSTRCSISSAILVYHRPTLTHFSTEFTHEKLPDPTVDGSQTHLEKPVGMIAKLWFPLVSLVFLCFSSNIHHCISWWLVTQPLKLVGPPSSLSRGFIGRERQNGRARCHGTVVPWQYCERQTAVRKGEFIECLKDFPSCYKLNTGHSIKT